MKANEMVVLVPAAGAVAVLWSGMTAIVRYS
jgi:hypothetical protein